MFRLTGTVPAPTAAPDDAEAAHAQYVIPLPRRMKMPIRPVLIIDASASLTRMSMRDRRRAALQLAYEALRSGAYWR
jgi:hypothetical protein